MDVITRIQNAIDALRAGGVQADRGYPQGLQMVPETPVAAVLVAHSDQQETALRVCVLGSAEQGGRACEELAQTVAQILRAQNARCEVGACRFDGDTGLFTVEVQAVWQEFLPVQVAVDQETLAYVTDFSAVQTRRVEQVTDEETGVTAVVNETEGWTLTVRELLPDAEVAAVDTADAFTLTLTREDSMETYSPCYWSSITLLETDGGLMRERVARSWAERVIE